MAESEAVPFRFFWTQRGQRLFRKFIKKHQEAARHLDAEIIPQICERPFGQPDEYKLLKPIPGQFLKGVRLRFTFKRIEYRIAYLVEERKRQVECFFIGTKEKSPTPAEYAAEMAAAKKRIGEGNGSSS